MVNPTSRSLTEKYSWLETLKEFFINHFLIVGLITLFGTFILLRNLTTWTDSNTYVNKVFGWQPFKILDWKQTKE